MKSKQMQNKKSKGKLSTRQVHAALLSPPKPKIVASFSLQDKPHRFELDETRSFILMIDMVLHLGSYLIVTGWSSETLEYQIYCDKELYPNNIVPVLRHDVNQHLGIDKDQKKGFALLAKCGPAWDGEIILKIHHQSFSYTNHFVLTQNTFPLDMNAVISSMGDAFEFLRDDIAHNADDWQESLKKNPHLRQFPTYSPQILSLEGEVASPCEEISCLSDESNNWDACIDGFDGLHIFGWAKHKSCNASQLVDIYINGTCVGVAVSADNFREDLLQAGIGNGCYGFNFLVEGTIYPPSEVVEVAMHEAKNKRIIAQHSFDTSAFKAKYKLRIDIINDDIIKGWCINIAKAWEILELDLYVDELFYKTIKTDQPRGDLKTKNISNGLGGFRTESPLVQMLPGSHVISFSLSDGSFSDEHIITATQIRRTSRIEDPTFVQHRVTIIVPIYNAPEDVAVCITRLLEYTLSTALILLIDDCSPDPAIADILSRHEGNNRVKVLRNDTNLGFTRTINRGIAETGENDVILLNSDARVTPGWLQGILTAAHSAHRIATVTPMSNRAGAFSAPDKGNNNMPANVDEATFSRAFRRHSLGLYPRVPTGNGFCMYISRRCINAIGVLDAEAFPRGYGEENDFCMRAFRAGWLNIIDDRTYVFHERSKSFGETKTQLMAEGRAVVDERYPEYKSAVSVFDSDEKILTARHCARRAWRDCACGIVPSTRILFVISTKTGGTPQTNQDLMLALPDSIESFVLHCDAKNMEVSKLTQGEFHVVLRHVLEDPVDPLSHLSAEYDAVVTGWLFDLDIDIVHIRHLAWHSLSLPRIAHELGKKVVCSFHDFYALTPTVNMLDDVGDFGGDTFFETSASDRISLWPKAFSPTPAGNWLTHWRERFAKAVSTCDAIVTTSKNARKLILESLQTLQHQRFFVIPHGRDFKEFYKLHQRPKHGEPLRLLVPGNINRAKGLDTILALAEHDRAGLLEFHILGNVQTTEYSFPPQIIKHGPYERTDFAKKVAAICPHFGLVFSIWDETYCHTLTELWSVGLPAFVFDFPMVGSRVRKSGAGWVLDHRDIVKLYDDIIRIAFDREAQSKAELALVDWQSGHGLANTTRVMAAQYYDIYARLLRSEEVHIDIAHTPRIAVVCPCDNDLQRGNASIHIRIWERTRNTPDRRAIYIRMTPQTLLASVEEGIIDGAIIQRTAIPVTMVSELLQALSHTATPYLLDLDDDLLHVPENKDPQGRYALYTNVLKLLLKKASVVSVSTRPLQILYEEFNDNVRLLPNLLSDRLWTASPAQRQSDDNIRALYMGTNTHDGDLAMILPALDAVAEIEPKFRLVLIGIDATSHLNPSRERWLECMPVPEKERDYISFVPWLRKNSRRFDFAIAPLENTDFNKSKSYIKLLDYAALGLPVVASNVEAYGDINAYGIRKISNSTKSWVEGLLQQIRSASDNETSHEKLREWVLEDQMLERSLPEFDAMVLVCLTK